MSIINGYSHSRFEIIGGAGGVVDLPLTNEQGMVETTIVRKIRHELVSLNGFGIKRVQQITGFDTIFDFHYESWVTGETLMKMRDIIHAAKAGSQLKLIPRIDEPWRYYFVLLETENFQLALRKGGAFCRYHRLPVFTFITEETEPELNWQISNTQETTYGGTGLPFEGSN